MTPKICLSCPNPLTGNQTKYCCRKCHNASGNRRLQNYALQRERANSRKREIINLKGGKCSICGYCKNITALCFHHTDPSIKEFTLDSRKLSNSTMESILKELEKCELLCQNCHHEIHHTDSKFLL